MHVRLPGFVALCAPVLMCQCYLAKAYTYEINTDTGRFTVVYHDIRSDGESDSAVAADWETLREAVASRETGLDTQVIAFDTAVLFVEDSVLSGRQEYRVRCPACFPSSAALLETVLKDHDGFAVRRLDRDVVLSADSAIVLSRASGSIARTANATYVLWAQQDTLLSFTWSQPEEDTGKSLLPYYRAEQKNAGGGRERKKRGTVQ